MLESFAVTTQIDDDRVENATEGGGDDPAPSGVTSE